MIFSTTSARVAFERNRTTAPRPVAWWGLSSPLTEDVLMTDQGQGTSASDAGEHSPNSRTTNDFSGTAHTVLQVGHLLGGVHFHDAHGRVGLAGRVQYLIDGRLPVVDQVDLAE